MFPPAFFVPIPLSSHLLLFGVSEGYIYRCVRAAYGAAKNARCPMVPHWVVHRSCWEVSVHMASANTTMRRRTDGRTRPKQDSTHTWSFFSLSWRIFFGRSDRSRKRGDLLMKKEKESNGIGRTVVWAVRLPYMQSDRC